MPETAADIREMIRTLPLDPGVYRFRDASGTVLYIGRATTLRRRVASYWGSLADRRRLRPVIARVAEIEAVVCASVHEAAWLERNLLAQRRPRANRAIGGMESEVYLRLGVDGLSLSHDATAGTDHEVFGPYLGGDQTRLALAGLHRAVPVRYADPRTGSERAMAVARGAGDPALMRALVADALRRRPEAVATIEETLSAVRDEQSRGLRFERAAQVQQQLEAFRWLISEQRVTNVVPARGRVAGYADGLLTTFRITAGRVRHWDREECDDAQARVALAATPPGWAEFAHRNAVLAAALRGCRT